MNDEGHRDNVAVAFVFTRLYPANLPPDRCDRGARRNNRRDANGMNATHMSVTDRHLHRGVAG